jgi:hypothetical protein
MKRRLTILLVAAVAAFGAAAVTSKGNYHLTR